jgi:thioredoxin 1
MKFSQVLNLNGHLSSVAVLSFLLALLVSSTAVGDLGDEATKSTTGGTSHNIRELLVGDTSAIQLFDAHPRFARGYEAFDADEVFKLPDEVSVLLFFGTWCHDSEREVPRLLKLLEAADLSEDKLTLIALDYRKREPEGRAREFNVRYTPTAIFLRAGAEVGRIVERPNASLAEDIKVMFADVD